MGTESSWEYLLHGIDFTLPGTKGPPDMENEYISDKLIPQKAGRKVFVQKIITEIWVYTDIEGKAFGHQGIQDIIIVGEMDYDEAIKLIGERKNKKRRSG